ncbi:hypothetical protein HDU96_008456 [Phlyctochytrium bullatum]|nr:hypothetical protein HDU96_008456 [Phlyctochytrium bullatum]
MTVVFGWDCHDVVYNPADVPATDEKGGYKDLNAKIDVSTLRYTPWENGMPHFLVDFYDPTSNKPLPHCPRGLLKRFVAEAAELGYQANIGIEYEFFNFAGPGVFEVAIRYNDPVELADQAHLFKMVTKALGLKRGIIPTFMAKPHNNLPGCSGHTHISLSSQDGTQNLFAPVEGSSNEDLRPGLMVPGLSRLGEHFLAGVLQGLPSFMACYAPNINSYKRLVENFWAPITVSYGVENRNSSIRLITPPTCSPSATRLEVRVPGADSNPYLAIAAILASGLEGIRKKIPLNIRPLEQHVEGVDPKPERLAGDLRQAVESLEAPNSFARRVFGDDFVAHFGGTRRHEWKVWEKAVTNWELKRYLEVV